MSLFETLSVIREVVVSKVFDFLLDKLASSELLQFATGKEVQEAIYKLDMELKEIRAVLDDAEERQVKEKSVKSWLTNLQNLAYDVEDVLDEFATEIGRRNLMMECRGCSSKRPKLIPDSFTVVMFNRDMMSKIKDITAKLKDLEPQRNQLLEEILQPTSVEIESHVHGRDKDKQTMLDLLLKSDNEANFVIPIVGIGGIGKTTLAQLVYNDASIQNHFNLKAWVCVSDDFDVMRITKEILQSVTFKPCDDNDLNRVQEKSKKVLSEKKFLIVLDDVWNENYHVWTILQSFFLTRTRGSKIIVTTRNHGVSSTMDDDCMSLFAQHALGARDFGRHPSLKEVAEKIVTKCNGLPLAAKTLGGLLRTNVDLDAWEDILQSEIWKLSEHQSGIIPALQLSYHHLPPHLKQCFAYCSILPKDYEFSEEEIILLWRAQGLQQEAQDKQCIDDLGRKYFRDLVSRSLLQMSIRDNFRYVMHDLFNDLAQSIAGEVCFKMEGNQKVSKHARHLSYMQNLFDDIKKFEGIYGKLSQPYFDITGSNKLEGIPSNVGKLADLQTLSNFVLDEDKGYQIRELKDLSNLKGKLSISGLQNIFEPQDAWMAKLCDKSRLEKIELRWSKDFKNERQYVDKKGNWNLSEVDEEARKFPKLRELLIRKCPLLSGSMPEHLPSLEKLSVSDCEKLIIPIQNFPMLSELKIERCKKVVYKGFAEDSSLKRVLFSGISKFSCAIECLMLKSIKVESLEIDDCCEELCFFRENNWGWLTQSMSIGVLSIGKCPQVEELMQLKIPCNIEQMKIKKFGRLEKLSTTLHFFSSLTMVELYDCPKLISLERSNLPWNLKVLSIYFCENLQFLLLDEDQNVNSNNACVLQELEIYSCESLKRINKNSLPSTLKQLKLKWCSKLESIAREVQDNSCLESIEIISCHMIKDLPQGSNQLKHLQSVNIWSCSNLICFPDNGLLLTNLKVLLLANCELLQGLPEGVHNLNSLEELVIKYCRNVTISFPEGPMIEWGLHRLTSLKSLWISNGCPDVVSFPQDDIGMALLSSLTHLNIVNFPKLEILSSNGFHNLTSLESLSIGNCPNLKFLPGNDMLASLLHIVSSRCALLEERCKRDRGPEWSKISQVPFAQIR
ncbi:hypothetical protein ES288_A10G238500v1 [Gossypium darwinii]|uniref:Uncharacterized protein n=1 Tax=Gossypium darwinii TaxID=34276 RepID=A0A5D2F2X3_GOSDA|nr:hypothetical protein ES288_A10G238500v1 [Gossypium darwinii]